MSDSLSEFSPHRFRRLHISQIYETPAGQDRLNENPWFRERLDEIAQLSRGELLSPGTDEIQALSPVTIENGQQLIDLSIEAMQEGNYENIYRMQLIAGAWATLLRAEVFAHHEPSDVPYDQDHELSIMAFLYATLRFNSNISRGENPYRDESILDGVRIFLPNLKNIRVKEDPTAKSILESARSSGLIHVAEIMSGEDLSPYTF